jgi:hypothetical protein
MALRFTLGIEDDRAEEVIAAHGRELVVELPLGLSRSWDVTGMLARRR